MEANEHEMTTDPAIVYQTINQAALAHNPLDDVLVTSEQMASRQPAPRQFFIDNLMPSYMTTLLYGDGGVGKSRLTRQLHAVTSGLIENSWLGKTINELGPSIIFTCEDDADEVHRHLLEMCGDDTRKLRRAEIDVVDLSVYKDRALFETNKRTGRLEETETFKNAADLISLKPYALVTWDSKNALFRGNDIDGAHADDCAHAMNDLVRSAGATAIYLAHPSQSGMATGKGTGGHSNWHNSFRSRLYFAKEATDPTLRKFSHMKGNYATDDTFACYVRVQDGLFVPVERVAGIEQTILAQAKERFVDLLREHNSQFNPAPMSDSSNSGKYAPKFFSRDPRVPNFEKHIYEAAMRELLLEGKVVRDQYGRPANPCFRLIVAGEWFGGNGLGDDEGP